MYNVFQIALKYFYYYVTASNGKGHGVHSPFIFQFIKKVLNDKDQYPAYEKVEGLRKNLSKDKRIIEVEDFGAGSSVLNTNRRNIAAIASASVKSKKYGQLLFRMVNFYEPQNILELGTSLGITTSYLAFANPVSKIMTIEGAKELLQIAKNNFEELHISNIDAVEGNFDDTLDDVIEKMPAIDFAFIDGNHKKSSTLNYFGKILAKTNSNSILVFDDIHWSREMEEAWEVIKQHSSVRCSLDLFFLGIIFFNDVFREKQHFHIRF